MTYRQPFRGEYPITQRYGEKDTSAFHTGIDYACPVTTPILASADGKVMHAGWLNGGWGYCVIIQHNDGNATLYAHLSKIGVVPRQKVEQGQVIGLSGSTGNSTGPHLHFEARRRWADYKSHFDPMDLPLMTVYDFANTGSVPSQGCPQLKDADAFREGDVLTVTAPLGAKAFHNDHFDYFSPYPKGASFYYTGKTTQHNGYTYMQVVPLARPVWVAVNDGETQILDG